MQKKLNFVGYLQFAILFFVIEIGTSTLILSGIYGSPNDNSATSTTQTNTIRKSTAQHRQNQNSKKIKEGCVVLPFNQKTKKSSDSLSAAHLRGGAICHFSIHKSLPIYKFHLVTSIDEIYELNVFERIKISKGNKKVISQTLEVGNIDPFAKGDDFLWQKTLISMDTKISD